MERAPRGAGRRRAPTRGAVAVVLAVLAVLAVGLGATGCSVGRAANASTGPTASTSPSSTPASPSTDTSSTGLITVDDAVFASPTGAFLCSLREGVADCLWPADLTGIHVPATACSPAAVEGPELLAGRPPAWLCGTDVGVLASAATVAWAPASLPRATGLGSPAAPELVDGLTLVSGSTRCRAAGRGVRCTGPGGWFDLTPGRFTTGRG